MKYATILMLFAFAFGCNDAKPPVKAEALQPEAPKPPATGKPNTDETVAGIQEFFPAAMGFRNIQVEKVSDPVEAPKQVIDGMGEAWVCSVTMNCDNSVGAKQQNRNWLVLINRENGRATVKDFYCTLESVENSPLGKEWFAQKGFAAPAVESRD